MKVKQSWVFMENRRGRLAEVAGEAGMGPWPRTCRAGAGISRSRAGAGARAGALRGEEEENRGQLDAELVPGTERKSGGKTREELAWEQVMEQIERSPEETGRLLEAWIQSEE